MKTYIKYLRAPVTDGEQADKLGPQEKACMSAVAKACGSVGGKALRTDVINALTNGGELTTRQDPARILSFYQPKFKDKGLIEIEKVADEKPAAAPKKTAAAPANAAGAAKGTAPGATAPAPTPAAATSAAG